MPVAFVILAGTALADPVVAESMGLDVWEIGRLEKDLQAGAHDAQRLDLELQTVTELMAVNEQIVRDVADGRLELSAAARRKCELNRHRQPVVSHLDRWRRGPHLEAKMAHDLAVRCRVVVDESRLAELQARLETEYLAAYRVVLPED